MSSTENVPQPSVEELLLAHPEIRMHRKRIGDLIIGQTVTASLEHIIYLRPQRIKRKYGLAVSLGVRRVDSQDWGDVIDFRLLPTADNRLHVKIFHPQADMDPQQIIDGTIHGITIFDAYQQQVTINPDSRNLYLKRIYDELEIGDRADPVYRSALPSTWGKPYWQDMLPTLRRPIGKIKIKE